MASRRLASSITLSGGTKLNSASLSTNFLISHGQATRSTLTYSRVIHFMGRLLMLLCVQRTLESHRQLVSIANASLAHLTALNFDWRRTANRAPNASASVVAPR